MNTELPTKYPPSQNRIVVFLNTSPQQKPDALQTSAPWQLKYFESRKKSAQGQIPHANGSTQNCSAKSSCISAGPCTFVAPLRSRAAKVVGLRPLSCWNCRFETRRKHGCLCLVSVVFCQVEVPATGRSLVQSSPTECVYVTSCDQGQRERSRLKEERKISIILVEPEQTGASVMLLRQLDIHGSVHQVIVY
jgi:hypothetical protein